MVEDIFAYSLTVKAKYSVIFSGLEEDDFPIIFVLKDRGGGSLIVDCRFSPKWLVDCTFLKEKSCRFVDCILAWKPVDCRPKELKLCRFVDSNCAFFKIVDCRFSRYYSSYYFQPEFTSIPH